MQSALTVGADGNQCIGCSLQFCAHGTDMYLNVRKEVNDKAGQLAVGDGSRLTNVTRVPEVFIFCVFDDYQWRCMNEYLWQQGYCIRPASVLDQQKATNLPR